MSTQSGPGSQSSDLLDDSELMTDDRELDADLVGKYNEYNNSPSAVDREIPHW